MYRCRICDREFDTIPDTAVLLNHRGRNRVYRFMDGTIHDLIHGRALHKRCHKTTKVDGCEFCFPPPKQAEKLPDPEQPVVEQSREVQVPEKLPEIIIGEVKPEVVAEFEPELTTALAIAFRRRRQFQN